MKKLTASDIGLGSITAGSIGAITVKGGSIRADITALDSIANITVKGGGIDGSTITAPEIGSLKISDSVANAFILAGANLGADRTLGGGDDTFAPGTIKSLQINGAVTASVFAAGLDPIDSIFHNGDDTILGGTGSAFGKITIKGDTDATSYFAAGAFKKAQIAGDKIDPATDPRFLVG